MYDIAERRRRREQRHKELEQCGLQLSHTGSYLDVEESINDQKEDFEGYDKQKKHSVILRTKLSVRVAGILEKLRTSSGRDLRRALFSLKQLFQDDQDLVHEFISAGGLDCLIQLGIECDQNHRSYILRALGEIMLFMDGMNGIIEHNQAIQWLYSLLTMQYRLVVKSALKLLIVFVEYAETNAALLIKALKQEDSSHGREIGSNIMSILKDVEQDSEITTYVMTLVNKTLSYIPDQDTFYDLTDALEKQGIEDVSQKVCSKRSSDQDLVEQFKLYEYALKQEDGDIDIPDKQKLSLRKARRSLDVTNQQRKSMRAGLKPTAEYSDSQKRLSLDSRTQSLHLENGEDMFSPQRRRREQRRSRCSVDYREDSELPSRPPVDDTSLRLQQRSAFDTSQNKSTIYQRSGSEEVSGITNQGCGEQASAQASSGHDEHIEGFKKSKKMEGIGEVDEGDYEGNEMREDGTTDDNSHTRESYSILEEHPEEVEKEHSTELTSGYKQKIMSGDDPPGSEVQDVVNLEDSLSLNSQSVEDSFQGGCPLPSENDGRPEVERLAIPVQEDEDESSRNDVSMESEMLQEVEGQKQHGEKVGQVSHCNKRGKATGDDEDEEIFHRRNEKYRLERAENMKTPISQDSTFNDDDGSDSAAATGNQQVIEEEDDDVFIKGTSVERCSNEVQSVMFRGSNGPGETENDEVLLECKRNVSGTANKDEISNITFPETSAEAMTSSDPSLVTDGRAENLESVNDFNSGDIPHSQRKRQQFQKEEETQYAPRESLSPGIDELQSERDYGTKSDDLGAVMHQRCEWRRSQKEAAMQLTDGETETESSSLQNESTNRSRRCHKHQHESGDQEMEERVDVKEGLQLGRRRRRREGSLEEISSGNILIDRSYVETGCEGEVGMQEKSRTRHRRRRRLKSAEDKEESEDKQVSVIERVDEGKLADASVLREEINGERMPDMVPTKTQKREEDNEMMGSKMGKADVENNSFRGREDADLSQERGSSKVSREQVSVPFGDKPKVLKSKEEDRDHDSYTLQKREKKEIETEVKEERTPEGDANHGETERERWRRERRERYRQKRAQRERQSSEAEQIKDESVKEKEENDVFISVPSERKTSTPGRSKQGQSETLGPHERKPCPQAGVLGDGSLPMEINDEDDLMRMLRGDSCTKAEIVQGIDDVMPRRRVYSRRRRREGSGSFEDLQSLKSGDLQKSVSEDSCDTITASTDSDPVNKEKDDKKVREERRVEDLHEPKQKPQRTKEEDEILNLLRGGITPVEVADEPESTSRRLIRQRRWRRRNRVASDENDDSLKVEDAEKVPSSLDQDVKGSTPVLPRKNHQEVTPRLPKESEISEKTEMIEKMSRKENEDELSKLPGSGTLVERNKEPAKEDGQNNHPHTRREKSHQSHKISDEQPYVGVTETVEIQSIEEQSTSSGRNKQKQRSEGKGYGKMSVTQTDEEDILSVLRGGDTDSPRTDIKEISDSNYELGQSNEVEEAKVQLKKAPADRRTSPCGKLASSEEVEEEQTVFRVSLKSRRPKGESLKKTRVEPKEEEELMSMLRGGGASPERNQMSDDVFTSKQPSLLRTSSQTKQETDSVEVRSRKDSAKDERDHKDSAKDERDRNLKPLRVKASIVSSTEKPEEGGKNEKLTPAVKPEPKEDVKVVRLKLRSKTAKVTKEPPRKKPDGEKEEDLMALLRGGLPTSDKGDDIPEKTVKLRPRKLVETKQKLEEESSPRSTECKLSPLRSSSREKDEAMRGEQPLLSEARNQDDEQEKSRAEKDEVVVHKHEKSARDEMMLSGKDEVEYTARRRRGMKEDATKRKIIVTSVEPEGEQNVLSVLKGGDVNVSASGNFEKSSKRVSSKQEKENYTETEKTRSGRKSNENDLLNILKGGDVSVSTPDSTELKKSAKPVTAKQSKENLSTNERAKSSSRSEEDDVLSILKGGDVGISRDDGDMIQMPGKVSLKKIEERSSTSEKKSVERKSREDDLLSILKGGDVGMSASGSDDKSNTFGKVKQIEGKGAISEKVVEKKPRESDVLTILKGGDVDVSSSGSDDRGKTLGKVKLFEEKDVISKKGVEKKPRESDLLSILKGGDIGVPGSATDDKERTPKVLRLKGQEDESTFRRNLKDGQRKQEEGKLSHSKVGDKVTWRKDEAKNASLRQTVVDQKAKEDGDLLDILKGGDMGDMPPDMPGNERSWKYGSKPQTDRNVERKTLALETKESLVDERQRQRRERQQADSGMMRRRETDRMASKFDEEPPAPVVDSLRKDERHLQNRQGFEEKTEKDLKGEKHSLDTAGAREGVPRKHQNATTEKVKDASFRKPGLESAGDKGRRAEDKSSDKFGRKQLSEEKDGTLPSKGKGTQSRNLELHDGVESKLMQSSKDQSSKISSRIESLSKANENQKIKKKEPFIPTIKQADIKEKILSKSSEEGHPQKKENFTPLVKQLDLKEKYLNRGQDQKQPAKKEHFVPSSKQSDIKEKLLSKTLEEPKHQTSQISKPSEHTDVRDKHHGKGTKQNTPKDLEVKSGQMISTVEERKPGGPKGKFLSSTQEGGSLPRNFKAGESQRTMESSEEFGRPRGKEKEGKSSRKKDTSKSLEELLDIAVAMKSMPRRKKQKQVESKVDGSKGITEAEGQKGDIHGRERLDRKYAQAHPGKEDKIAISPGDSQQKRDERLNAAGKRESFGRVRAKDKFKETVEQDHGYPRQKIAALEEDVEGEKQKRGGADMHKKMTGDRTAIDVHKCDQGEVRRRKREDKGEAMERPQNRKLEEDGNLHRRNKKLEEDGNLHRRSKNEKRKSAENTLKEVEGFTREEEVTADRRRQILAVEKSTDDAKKREGSEEASDKKKYLLDRWLKQKPKDRKQVSDDVVAPRKKNLHEKFQSQRDKWLEGSKEGSMPKKIDKRDGKKPSKLNSKYQTMVKEADLVEEQTKQDGGGLRRGRKKEEIQRKEEEMFEEEEVERLTGRKDDGCLSSPLQAYEDDSDGEGEEDYTEDEDTYDGELVDEVDIPDLTLSYSDGYSDEEGSTQFFSFPSDEEVSGHSERTRDSTSAKIPPPIRTQPRYSSSPLRQMTRPSEESSETLCLTDSEEDESLLTLKESEMSLEQQLRREVGDDDSVFLAGSFESLDMKSGSELSSLGERSDGLEVRSLLGHEEELENRLMKTKSLPSNLDNCHRRRDSYPSEEVFSSFTPPSRRRGIKQSEESLVSQAESAESLMSGGTGTSIESGVSAESGIEMDEKIREGLQELKEELLDEDRFEESIGESEDEGEESREEAVVHTYPDEYKTHKKTSRKSRHKRSSPSAKMRVPEVVIQEPLTPTENGYGMHHRRKGAKKLQHIPEEPRLSFIPPTSTAMERRRRRPLRDQSKNDNLKNNKVTFRKSSEAETGFEENKSDLPPSIGGDSGKGFQRTKDSDAINVGLSKRDSHHEISSSHQDTQGPKSDDIPSPAVENGISEEHIGNKELSLENSHELQNKQSLKAADEISRKVSVSLRNTDSLEERKEKLRHSSIDEIPPSSIELENKGNVQLLQDQLKKQGSQESSHSEDSGGGNVSQLAKGLAALKAKAKTPSVSETVMDVSTPQKKETVHDWMMVLMKNKRKLQIKEWDFRDLTSKDDDDVFALTEMDSRNSFPTNSGVAPPPPPMGGMPPPPPPPPPPIGGMPPPPPPPPGIGGPRPPPPPGSMKNIQDGYKTYPPKGKKTIRLFWRQFTPVPENLLKKNNLDKTIWKSLVDVKLDTLKLETLFESRGKDFVPRKMMDSQKKQFITVLNSKRSNAINIGLTVLPPAESIKQAILQMDAVVLNKENVERLLTMAPTDEEINMIKEAQKASPDTPLGSAEDFLMMLSSTGALEARLKLWLFKIDYDNREREIAEPLSDMKEGMDSLKKSKTFTYILAALRAVGNFLNGANVEGFHIEYLSKVSEVKDTSSSKQSLLFHLCSMIREQFPDSTDFFSEIGSIKRCAKVDFEELETNLTKLEDDCKASWEYLELIYTKHAMRRETYRKIKDFLTECAQQILVLKVVHQRVSNRFRKLLLYLGMNVTAANDMKLTDFCTIVSEFALEYRTVRERLIEIEKKKEDHKKRNKTRGKMITEKFLSKENAEDVKLKALLTNRGTAPGDETLQNRTRARPSNIRRTLKGGLTDAEKQALGLVPKTQSIQM